MLEVAMVLIRASFCIVAGSEISLAKAILVFFTLVVCEAVLGIRVLIKRVRSYGRDLSSFI